MPRAPSDTSVPLARSLVFTPIPNTLGITKRLSSATMLQQLVIKRGPSLVWSFLQKKSLTSAENLGTVEALLILIHGGVYYKVVPVETCCNV